MDLAKLCGLILIILFILVVIIWKIISNFSFSYKGGNQDAYSDFKKLLYDTTVKGGGNTTVKGGGDTTVKKEDNWYDYETWEDLSLDPELSLKYYQDKKEFKSKKINKHNWEDVLKVLIPKTKKSEEYYGIINMINGKLKVSEIHSCNSKSQIDYNSFKTVALTPGLIFFHTHNDSEDISPYPSCEDLITATSRLPLRRYVAFIIVSKVGIVQYGPNAQLLGKYIDTYDKISHEDGTMVIWQSLVGIIGALNSNLFWESWDIEKLQKLYKQFLFELNVIPLPSQRDIYKKVKYEAYGLKIENNALTIICKKILDMQKKGMIQER